MTTVSFEAAYEKARLAGKAAGEAAAPVPMVVQQPSNPLDDSSPPVKEWFVADGVCGFAWVNVRPGNSSFARWLVKQKVARKAYGGGVDIWISAFGQSMQRKEACAAAMAKVLREELGINAYANSRMD